MKPKTPITFNVIKIYLAIALIAMAGFLLTSSVINSYQNDGSSSQLLMSEVQETMGDSESALLDDHLDYFFKDLVVVLSGFIVITLYYRKKVPTRLNFLLHIRPRSPPTYSFQ